MNSTANTKVSDRRTSETPAVAPRVDFETRLMMSTVAMDVATERHAGGAHREAQKSVDAASVIEHPVDDVPTPTFTSHPVLKRAGHLIRTRGWHQGAYESTDGSVCLVQAVRLAAQLGGGSEDDALSEIYRRIKARFGDPGWSASGWNDRADRTRDDVLSILW